VWAGNRFRRPAQRRSDSSLGGRKALQAGAESWEHLSIASFGGWKALRAGFDHL